MGARHDMAVIIVTIAAWLGLGAPLAQAQTATTVVPRTTITIDERPTVVQPAPLGPAAPAASPAPAPTPTPEERRRRDQQAQQQVTASPPAPVRPRAPGPRRPTNGYSSFLTGPIDL